MEGGQDTAVVREVVSNSRLASFSSPSTSQLLTTPTKHGPPGANVVREPLLAKSALARRASPPAHVGPGPPRSKFQSGVVHQGAATSGRGKVSLAKVSAPVASPPLKAEITKGRPVGSVPKIPLIVRGKSGEIEGMNFGGIFQGRLPTAVAKPARERYQKLRHSDPVAAGDAKELADLCHSAAGLSLKAICSAPWSNLHEAWSTITASNMATDVLKCLPIENMTSAMKRLSKERQASGKWEEAATIVTLAVAFRSGRDKQFGLYFDLLKPRNADIYLELNDLAEDEEGEKKRVETNLLDATVDCMIGGQFYLLVSGFDDSREARATILSVVEAHLACAPEDKDVDLPVPIAVCYRTLKGFGWLCHDEPSQFHRYGIEDAQFVIPDLMQDMKSKAGKLGIQHQSSVKPGPGLARWLKQKVWRERQDLMTRAQAACMTRGEALFRIHEALVKEQPLLEKLSARKDDLDMEVVAEVVYRCLDSIDTLAQRRVDDEEAFEGRHGTFVSVDKSAKFAAEVIYKALQQRFVELPTNEVQKFFEDAEKLSWDALAADLRTFLFSSAANAVEDNLRQELHKALDVSRAAHFKKAFLKSEELELDDEMLSLLVQRYLDIQKMLVSQLREWYTSGEMNGDQVEIWLATVELVRKDKRVAPKLVTQDTQFTSMMRSLKSLLLAQQEVQASMTTRDEQAERRVHSNLLSTSISWLRYFNKIWEWPLEIKDAAENVLDTGKLAMDQSRPLLENFAAHRLRALTDAVVDVTAKLSLKARG